MAVGGVAAGGGRQAGHRHLSAGNGWLEQASQALTFAWSKASWLWARDKAGGGRCRAP